MAGAKRKRYDDESLKAMTKKLEIVQQVITDTMAGSSMMESIRQHHLSMHQFRRVLETLECLRTDNNIEPSAPMRLDTDFMCTPIETLYGDIFGIHDSAWEEFIIPDDAAEAYDYLAPKVLKEREQRMISLYYFDEMTLEQVGKIYNLSRDRVRQLILKGIRKLRHPQHAKVLSMGLKEYQEHEAIMKQNAELEKQRLQEAFQKELDEKVEKAKDGTYIPDKILNMDIADLELSVRSYNCMRRAMYDTVKDVLRANLDDLMRVRNLGKKSMIDVLKQVYTVFDNVGMSVEEVFALRQALIEDEHRMVTDSYMAAVRSIMKGGRPVL